ncbi:MAG: hypothetical protein ACI38P_11650, partial [Cellulosimicrobium funkei]
VVGGVVLLLGVATTTGVLGRRSPGTAVAPDAAASFVATDPPSAPGRPDATATDGPTATRARSR